jgi:hypothetical protein
VIVLEVSTQTSLTDPSATGRERQLSVPSQSAWLKHASHSFLGVLHAAIVNPNTKASNIFMKFIPPIALRSCLAHQTRAGIHNQPPFNNRSGPQDRSFVLADPRALPGKAAQVSKPLHDSWRCYLTVTSTRRFG